MSDARIRTPTINSSSYSQTPNILDSDHTGDQPVSIQIRQAIQVTHTHGQRVEGAITKLSGIAKPPKHKHGVIRHPHTSVTRSRCHIEVIPSLEILLPAEAVLDVKVLSIDGV